MGSNIIELAKLGHERAAELKASCGAVDVRSLAQLISDLASQLEVQYVRAEESQREFRAADATINNLELKLTDMAVQLANAESKCRELAAENAAIKAMNDCLSEELRGYESDGAFEGPKMHLLWWKTETPATDDFLAEVRAQGVEMFAKNLESMQCHIEAKWARSFISEVLSVKNS
ncbi:eae-like domain protein [Salmonella enterica]|nr:eae-like domain protein [Salmonella enterica]